MRQLVFIQVNSGVEVVDSANSGIPVGFFNGYCEITFTDNTYYVTSSGAMISFAFGEVVTVKGSPAAGTPTLLMAQLQDCFNIVTGGGGGGGGNVVVTSSVLPTNAAQESGGNLAAAAASLASIDNGIPVSLGQKLSAGSMSVVLASDEALPLPTGAATSANQATEISSLATIVSKLPNQGQNVMANSQPVAIASDQTPVPISDIDTQVSGTINSLNGSFAVSLNGDSAVYATITGTWSGSIQYQGLAADGATWIPLNAATGGPTNAYITAALTSNGSSRIMLPAGFRQVRAYSTAWSSGTANIGFTASGGVGNVEAIQLNAANLNVTVGNTSSNPVPVNQNSNDNTVLYSGNISTTTVGSGLDSTGYQTVIIQVTGTWNGSFYVEGSTDNTNYGNILPVVNTDRTGPVETIINNGIYVLQISSRYFRINPSGLELGTISINIIGRTVPSLSAIDILSQAMDAAKNTPMYVSEVGIKKDITNAIILSDNIQFQIYGIVGNTIVIDTTGYQSINFSTMALVANITASNDGITYGALTGTPAVLGAMVTAITANASFSFPCVARYIKITPTTSGTAMAYLKNTPWIPGYTTTPYVAGAGGVNGGVAGVQSVGGNIGVGVAPTANPVISGAIDTGGLTRRLLSDTTGKLIIASFDASGKPITYSYDQSGNNRILGSLSPSQSPQNVAALTVADQTQVEGQSSAEILNQILIELRTTNQLLQQIGNGQAQVDEPTLLRSDTSLINFN